MPPCQWIHPLVSSRNGHKIGAAETWVRLRKEVWSFSGRESWHMLTLVWFSPFLSLLLSHFSQSQNCFWYFLTRQVTESQTHYLNPSQKSFCVYWESRAQTWKIKNTPPGFFFLCRPGKTIGMFWDSFFFFLLSEAKTISCSFTILFERAFSQETETRKGKGWKNFPIARFFFSLSLSRGKRRGSDVRKQSEWILQKGSELWRKIFHSKQLWEGKRKELERKLYFQTFRTKLKQVPGNANVKKTF